MSHLRRAVCWFLVVALGSTLAVIATAEPPAHVDTTPTTWFSGPGDLTEVQP